MAGELLSVDASMGAEHVGLRRREPRLLEWEGQYESPKRHEAQDVVDEVRRLRRHPTPCKVRVEASLFARKRHVQVMLAPLAVQMDELREK